MDRTIPVVDPNVKTIGVSKLRQFNASSLKETDKTFVIQENDNPVAVLVSYERYLIIQEQLRSVLETVELFTTPVDLEGVSAGLKDVANSRTRPLSEIRAKLKRRG